MKNLLITAEQDEADILINGLYDVDITPVHLPLEQYKHATDKHQQESMMQSLDKFQFVIYGSMRNARHFITWMDHSGSLDEFQQKIHLVMNEPEAAFLESSGIPAIMPREGASAIDIMEFLLRISVDGAVLYPCAEESSEEMPGLLQELEMNVLEFIVCRSVPFERQVVQEKREQVQSRKPDAVLFHSRGSVTRTKAAFPDIDLSLSTLIAASRGVAGKLEQEGYEADYIASGSWKSVLATITSPSGTED